MTYGFAYGRTSEGMRGRAVALAVSAGIKRADYAPSGRYHFTMEQILAPFELAFRYYFHADWRGFSRFTAPRRRRASITKVVPNR